MNSKNELIKDLAIHLAKTKTVMSGSELADYLNRNGLKTGYGSEYAGGRGTFTLIEATYDKLIMLGDNINAEKVARAFVKDDGTYAFETKK